MDTTDKVLEHHGVKGMKWGQRKRSGGSGLHSKSMSEIRKTKTSEDSSKATQTHEKIKVAGTKSVSNAELQHLVNRMNLEQQFSRLSESTKQVSAGKKFANSLLKGSKDIGKQTAKTVVAGVLAKQVAKALAKTALG